METSLFTTDTATPCALNIIPSDLETEFPNNVHDHSHNNTCIHFYSKHKYHNSDNGDSFIYKDKYTVWLQQELRNGVYMIQSDISQHGH